MTPRQSTIDAQLERPLPRLSPKDERFTTRATLGQCLQRANVRRFELDVAACKESHVAPDYFGLDNGRDGLAEWWWGHSFGNPPFTQWAHWLAAAWQNFKHAPKFRSHSMILPNDKTEQPAWHELVEPFRDRPGSPLRVHFMRDRTRYWSPGRRGKAQPGSPFFGSVQLIWRRPW